MSKASHEPKDNHNDQTTNKSQTDKEIKKKKKKKPNPEIKNIVQDLRKNIEKNTHPDLK